MDLTRPIVVGILNITPDSFSDGAKYLEPGSAVEQAKRLILDGAGMLDIGAESTRPGAGDGVSAEEEWRRLEPVLLQVRERFPDVAISVDTRKASVADSALKAGAWIINDVSGLRHDPEIADVVAASGASMVLMHSRGSVGEMATYQHAVYEDVVEEVLKELGRSVEEALKRGVGEGHLVVDPGFGFAKTPEQNFQVLNELERLAIFGLPVLVGPSRKRFLADDRSRENPEKRDAATAAACLEAYARGADLFRVHNVEMVNDALKIAHRLKTTR